MRTSQLAAAFGGLLIIATGAVGASEHRTPAPREIATPPAHTRLLVEVKRVTAGAGPDGRPAVLFEGSGLFLPLDRLDQLAGVVDGVHLPLSGVYTGLTATLGTAAWVEHNGRFSESALGAPVELPLSGAVIMSGEAKGYGMALYPWSPATQRPGGGFSRGEDEEGEEDDD